MQFPAKNNARNRIIQQFLIDFQLLLFIQTIHIGILYKTDYLKAGCLKMLEISCKLQCRPVDVGLRDLNFGNIDFRRQIFPFPFFNYFCQTDTCHNPSPLTYIPVFNYDNRRKSIEPASIVPQFPDGNQSPDPWKKS